MTRDFRCGCPYVRWHCPTCGKHWQVPSLAADCCKGEK